MRNFISRRFRELSRWRRFNKNQRDRLDQRNLREPSSAIFGK